MKKQFIYFGLGLLTIWCQQGLYAQNADQVPNPIADEGVPVNPGSQSGGYYPDEESPWFDNDNLRRELELDDDQVERLNDAYGSTWKRLRENQGARSDNNGQSRNDTQSNATDRLANSGRGLDENQGSTRLNEYRDRFDDEFNRSTSDVFRNRQQQERFNQLRLQHQGYGAFNNPALQRQMNLNDTQIRQLQDLNREWDTQMDEFRNSYANDREGTTNRYNDFNRSSRTRFEGILNDQQRQQYNQMTGNQFDFGADARLGNRNTNARANTQARGSQIGTPGNVPQGSQLGTPGNVSQGSGIGTQTDTGPQGSGLGTSTGAAGGVGTNDQDGTGTGSGTGTGTGTGAGTGTGTGAGSGAGGGTGTGSGAGSGSGSGSGGSGS
jgi:hypothetical protein